MAEAYTKLYEEIKNCEPVFSLFQDDEMCYEAAKSFVEFIESDSNTCEIDTKKINFFLRYKSQNGRTDDTGCITRIEKVSQWSWIDRFCYAIWFPWGISQRYLVRDDGGKCYLARFSNLSQKTLDCVEAILHEDKVRFDFGKEMR